MTCANERARWGKQAEDWACELLRSQGAEILQRNFRRRCGELDLIAIHAGVLLIVEVRLRRHRQFGGAAASITFAKRQRLVRTTQLWLQAHPDYAHYPVRFDVIAIEPSNEGRWRRQWLPHTFTC